MGVTIAHHLLGNIVVCDDVVVTRGVVVFHAGLEVLAHEINLVGCTTAAGFVKAAAPFVAVGFCSTQLVGM